MDQNHQTRRTWLAAGLRWCTVGALAAVTASLLGRTGDRVPRLCLQSGSCGRCRQLQSCRLPAAIETKGRERNS
jgi:hypothetical protein